MTLAPFLATFGKSACPGYRQRDAHAREEVILQVRRQADDELARVCRDGDSPAGVDRRLALGWFPCRVAAVWGMYLVQALAELVVLFGHGGGPRGARAASGTSRVVRLSGCQVVRCRVSGVRVQWLKVEGGGWRTENSGHGVHGSTVGGGRLRLRQTLNSQRSTLNSQRITVAGVERSVLSPPIHRNRTFYHEEQEEHEDFLSSNFMRFMAFPVKNAFVFSLCCSPKDPPEIKTPISYQLTSVVWLLLQRGERTQQEQRTCGQTPATPLGQSSRRPGVFCPRDPRRSGSCPRHGAIPPPARGADQGVQGLRAEAHPPDRELRDSGCILSGV
jgi:hypothetical protein